MWHQFERIAFVNLAGEHGEVARHVSGIAELDRVVGGGLVTGSSVLLAGDPGIGKSTLLLQAAGALAANGKVREVARGLEGEGANQCQGGLFVAAGEDGNAREAFGCDARPARMGRFSPERATLRTSRAGARRRLARATRPASGPPRRREESVIGRGG